MEFFFKGVSLVRYKHEQGEPDSLHMGTDFHLEAIDLTASSNLDQSYYFDEEGLPKAPAIKPLSQCFIQGLVGNIHAAHQTGHWDSAEHLRYIISELERGLAEAATIRAGESTKKGDL